MVVFLHHNTRILPGVKWGQKGDSLEIHSALLLNLMLEFCSHKKLTSGIAKTCQVNRISPHLEFVLTYRFFFFFFFREPQKESSRIWYQNALTFPFLKNVLESFNLCAYMCVCVTCVAPTEARRGPGITDYSETLNVGAGN